jgi:hypothetical protein
MRSGEARARGEVGLLDLIQNLGRLASTSTSISSNEWKMIRDSDEWRICLCGGFLQTTGSTRPLESLMSSGRLMVRPVQACNRRRRFRDAPKGVGDGEDEGSGGGVYG